MLKGIFKDTNWIGQLLVLAFLFIVGLLVGSAFSSVIPPLYGIPSVHFINDMDAYPTILLTVQFLSQLFAFVLPPFATAYLCSDNLRTFLHFDKPTKVSTSGWVALSMIIALPLINLSAYLNQTLFVLPESFQWLEEIIRQMEEMNAELVEAMMMDGVLGYVVSLIVIAVMAALGEELLFRGALQSIFGKSIRNPHVVIWLVAAIFSFIHFQFYGFIPRLLMGAYFGYLLYYTGNLWMPILAHFVNNAFVVTIEYLFSESTSNMEAVDAIGTGSTWWVSVVSLALFVFVFRQIKRSGKFE